MLRKACRAALLLPLLLVAPASAQAPEAINVVLWPAGHPTLHGQDQTETHTFYREGPARSINRVTNVHNPSFDLFLPPADKNTGAVLLVLCGGGHESIGYGPEGVELAEWMNPRGVAVAVLRYRLARTPGFNYSVEGETLLDTQRSVRILRQRAAEWRLNPERIGVVGWSAGGAPAALINQRFDRGKADAEDAVEQVSSQPDFVCIIFGGWRRFEGPAPMDAAPMFLTSAGIDDTGGAGSCVSTYKHFFQSNVPVELHIYAHGRHAGGIRPRGGIPFGTWHHRFHEWMADLGMLKTE